MFIIFFDIKLTVHKEFVLAGQTVTSAYYCDVYGDCVKMCEDFTLNFGDKELAVASEQSAFSCFIFHQGTFDQKQHDGRLRPAYSPYLAPCDLSLFPRLKTKLKGLHFGTIEMTEGESQAVLNTLTEHDIQMHLRNRNGI
jgi:hypothetical protein